MEWLRVDHFLVVGRPGSTPNEVVGHVALTLRGPFARVFRSLHSLPTQAPQPLRFLTDCFELTELN